jgi:hypothetical protein
MFEIIKITMLLYLAAFVISMLVAAIIKLMYHTTQTSNPKLLNRHLITEYRRVYRIRRCRRNRLYKELNKKELYFYGYN